MIGGMHSVMVILMSGPSKLNLNCSGHLPLPVNLVLSYPTNIKRSITRRHTVGARNSHKRVGDFRKEPVSKWQSDNL